MSNRQIRTIILANVSRTWPTVDPQTTRMIGFSGQSATTHYYVMSLSDSTKEAEAVELRIAEIRIPPHDVLSIRLGYSARENVLVVEDLESNMRVLGFLLGIEVEDKL